MLRALARSVLTVPIVYRKRDTEGDVVSETIIGVMHALNKRQGESTATISRFSISSAARHPNHRPHRPLSRCPSRLCETIKLFNRWAWAWSPSAPRAGVRSRPEMRVLGIRQKMSASTIATCSTRAPARRRHHRRRFPQQAVAGNDRSTPNGEGRTTAHLPHQVDPILRHKEAQSNNGFGGAVVLRI